MNFLAHAHLSNGNKDILLGNLIADSVKGKVKFSYSLHVQLGIDLHRKIDVFTDSHKIFKHSKSLIQKETGRYSGVVIDIFYDHFLARKWLDFSLIPLDDFTVNVYHELAKNYQFLPARVKRILPYMMAQNWLNSYANFTDLSRIFYGMDRRTHFKSGMQYAVGLLIRDYEKLEDDFIKFYPQIIQFAEEETRHLNHKLNGYE